jgi:hypothetical protein
MKRSDEQFSEKEAQQRFDKTLRAALSTPPTHLKNIPKKNGEPRPKPKKAQPKRARKNKRLAGDNF